MIKMTMRNIVDAFPHGEYSLHDTISAQTAFRSAHKKTILDCLRIVNFGNKYSQDTRNTEIYTTIKQAMKTNNWNKARLLMFFVTKIADAQFRGDVKQYISLKKEYNL